ncbi:MULTISPECIES: acetate--CoA ligase [unclassified Modicisalibacter]|uniref:acetate--CoA ligase n=1 Tax=unclassified Modicisalibacter TaxID=2679913 RepID=UPI001CCE21AE|nr:MULTISPECIES: acetate--CoA ligase [unclassified Modicisalibacter]MBZ9559261.1 acetate--CoA ligase [Modicisalibacter sp. R2A 31.J]MBZ9576574.1 acetate--CoA ligase [Modicisalibacter sp. MOD 31.J]
MTEQQKVHPVSETMAANAWADKDTYLSMYQQSVDDPEGFWAEQAKRLDWSRAPTRVKHTSFDPHNVDIRWFEDGELNACHNCVDRHLESRGDQPAIIWEGDEPGDSKTYTFRDLHARTSQLANAFKALGVGKGDTVTLYMPMIPEAAMAMLACARIGAIHSVVFGGFSPDALAQRVVDAQSKLVITADESVRGGKRVPLKDNVDAALTRDGTDVVDNVLVVQRTGGDIEWHDGRDVWFHEVVDKQSSDCPVEPMNAEDALFILYTSGSTGKPKGLKHTTGGYLLHASLTHQYVFDYHDGEVYWCAADVGWITGHSYIVYGPLANGATTLMFEGVPSYPTSGRMGEVIDKHGVSILYTSPTAIRALMAHGENVMDSSKRDSLRVLGSVGEPINPEAWEWFYRVIGNSKCPIVDTWWQTETGGIMIAPLPGAIDLKPGSATRPFFGVQPALVDSEGNILEGATNGNLVILDSWPGQARTIWKNHERFVDTYFSAYKGMYFTGDGCRRDEDGYYWITGRVDDVINVSGHRMGTAEIESSLVAHEAVAEAAVVGYPHDIKGQGIYIYVTLGDEYEPSDELKKELTQWVRKDIGPIASPDVIQWAPSLPKTRSGKIMRRILRKIAANETDGLGDTSTLADPSVVEDLIANRANR